MQEKNQEDEEEGREGDDDGAGKDYGEEDTGFNTFSWLMMVNKVSNRTKLDWNKVWDMNIYEFFNILKFDIEYSKWETKEANIWKTQN